MTKKILSVILAIVLMASIMAGCSKYEVGEEKVYEYDDAIAELEAFNKELSADTREPKLNIYNDTTTSSALADISTFPFVVKGNGGINIEIAAATEMSKEKAPDDWLTAVAKDFNSAGITYNGKTVTVSVRKITSGEVLTYMTEGDYKPDVYAPSSWAWGEMLSASGVDVVKLSDRIAGNTAGILMQKETYNEYIAKYKQVSVDKVLEAAINSDLAFAYTNPYTSSTGLNILTSMLYAFDHENPLSQTAQDKLLEYQKTAPPVAYTTSELQGSAAKGLIKAMVMEEQAYINTPELQNYIYTPVGIRHDHPVYTFGYVSNERQEVAKLFVEYCLNDKSQQLAEQKGFNRHNDYKEQSTGLDGLGYLSAQKIWKTNKNGGQPIIAVFVADVSGSMAGRPINAMKDALIATSSYIGSDNYVGLVSFADEVHIDLPIKNFDEEQRAYFTGAVKALDIEGSTATYNAVLIALKMMLDKQAEVPNAKMMLFVLSDGDQNRGYNLDRVAPIVGGLKVPVYSIGYNLSDGSRATSELKRLSNINEASLINASSEDLVNQLRNLFNTQL